tara:strand:+ start:3651 stop:6068 length:2418 start_codon:yes stop_codon:yes gene_type:complete
MSNIVKYIVSVATAKAEKNLKSTTKDTEKLGEELVKSKKSGLEMGAQIGSAMTGLRSTLKMVSGGVGFLKDALVDTTTASYEFTKGVIDSINDLNDLSAQAGLSAQSIQAVSMAFVGSGQSAGAAHAFIKKFPKLFADLASGEAKVTAAAKQLGISLKDLTTGEMLSADQILLNITRSLQAVKDPTEKATAGFLLLGRSGGNFLQAFGNTSEFENFLDVVEEFGVQTGPEASRQAAIFQESISFLDSTIAGLKQRLVESVGGVALLNSTLRSIIIIVVSLQEKIKNNSEMFSEFGNTIKAFSINVIGFLQSQLNGFVSFLQGTSKLAFAVITGLSLAANAFGIISDDTTGRIIANSALATNAAIQLGDILNEVNKIDFNGSKPLTGKVKTALDALDKLLIGLDKDKEKIKFSIDDPKTGNNAEKEMDKEEEARRKRAEATQQKRDSEATSRLKIMAMARSKLAEIDKNNLKSTLSEREKVLHTYREELKQINALAQMSNDINSGIKAENALRERTKEILQGINEEQKNQRSEDRAGKIEGATSAVRSIGSGQLTETAGASIDIVSKLTSKLGASLAGVLGKVFSKIGASLASPIVGAIIAGIGVITVLGSKTTKERQEDIVDQIKSFQKGLEILPDLLLRLLPSITLIFSEALINGITLAVINAFMTIVEFLKTIFTPEGRRERRRNSESNPFVDRLKDFLNPYKSSTFAGGGSFIPAAEGGMKFTGSQRSGMALLHQGEFVVPQSGQKPQQVDRQMSQYNGGGMNIVINAQVVEQNAVDALVRRIEERFNSNFGLASSSLFGGR